MLLCRRGLRSNCEKHRASFLANGGSARAKNSLASGESTTSYIAAHLPPIHAFARRDRFFCLLNAALDRRTAEVLNVVSERFQPIVWNSIHGFFYFSSYRARSHIGII